MRSNITGEVEQAAHLSKSASQINLEDADLLVNLGKALHAIGQYNPAKEALLKAVILNPDEEAANHTLGVLYDEEQNYEAASGHLGQTAGLLSQSYRLRCYLGKGLLVESKKQLKKITEASNVNALIGSLV